MNLTETASEITLNRDGERKLKFKGWKLASVNNRWINGVNQTRWQVLTAYKTTGNNYVLCRESVSLWQGESNHLSAEIFKSIDEFVAEVDGVTDLEKELLDELGEQFSDLATEVIE